MQAVGSNIFFILPPPNSYNLGQLPPKVVFHSRCLPPKVVFHQRSSSTKGRLSPKVVFHRKSSSNYQSTLVDLILVRAVKIRPGKRSETFWEHELRAQILLSAHDRQFQGRLILTCIQNKIKLQVKYR